MAKQGALREKAALTAFGALLARYTGKPDEVATEAAAKAWQYADLFIKARENAEAAKYAAVLREYKGAEALRRIIELDNEPTSERMIDHLVGTYGTLEAYEAACLPRRTLGQKAVADWIKAAGKKVL